MTAFQVEGSLIVLLLIKQLHSQLGCILQMKIMFLFPEIFFLHYDQGWLQNQLPDITKDECCRLSEFWIIKDPDAIINHNDVSLIRLFSATKGSLTSES